MSNLLNYPYISELEQLSKQRKAKVYLVGGFLRDYVLGKPGTDFDFCMKSDAIEFARAFADQIKGAFIILDEDFGCARVVKKVSGTNSKRCQTPNFYTYDFANFRQATLKKDLKHRDFTINTLYVDIAKKEALDHIQDKLDGLADIKVKTIRMVGDGVLQEDPLRLMRAYAIQAKYGFKIHPDTRKAIKRDVDLIRQVSRERVRDELFKILQSPRAFQTLKAMKSIGLLTKIMPQVHVMFGVDQGAYHHLDVWNHSLEVVKQFEKIVKNMSGNDQVMTYLNESIAGDHTRLGLVKLGCLLHDIGKPETRQYIDGRFRFHQHEKVGKGIASLAAKNLKFSTKERRMVEDYVYYHLRPGFLSNHKVPTKRMIYRFFRDTDKEAVAILLLSLADQRSACGPLTTEYDQQHHEEICKKLLKEYFAIPEKKEPKIKLITGKDVMKVLNIKPCERVGEVLQAIEEAQALGKITTREEALELVKAQKK